MIAKRIYWLGLVAVVGVAIGVKVTAVDPVKNPMPMDHPIVPVAHPVAPVEAPVAMAHPVAPVVAKAPAIPATQPGMMEQLGILQNKFVASMNAAQMMEASTAFQKALDAALNAHKLDAGVVKVMEGGMVVMEAIAMQAQLTAATKTELLKSLNELSAGLQKMAKTINVATATPGEAYIVQIVNALVRGAVAGLNSQPMPAVKQPVAQVAKPDVQAARPIAKPMAVK